MSVLGRPLWYELMTTDMAAAEAFYKPVVGWTTTPFGDLGMPYSMWTRPDGVPAGGVMNLPDELITRKVPPHWMMYIGVDKLEAAAAHATRLGGGTLSPVIDVPDVGRMQALKDPQGAAFSIYEPASAPQTPEGPPQHGDASWLELYTTDSTAAMSFYGELFGWRATESMDMGPMGVYRMFGRSSQSMGGMMNKVDDMVHLPTAWLIYFYVPDVHAAAERVKANGGRVVNGPMEVPGGDWIVQGMDPQGAAFALHGKKRL
jgi:predicted enzyme related to lactoylglutathione lyase